MAPLEVEYMIKILVSDWTKLHNILRQSCDLQLTRTTWKAKLETAIINLDAKIAAQKVILRELQSVCEHDWEDISDPRGNRDLYRCKKCHDYRS